jgi:hypothetical protein
MAAVDAISININDLSFWIHALLSYIWIIQVAFSSAHVAIRKLGA